MPQVGRQEILLTRDSWWAISLLVRLEEAVTEAGPVELDEWSKLV